MFTRIQTRAFRCLQSVDQELGSFRALVGPNASGKTTFLDVIALLSELLRNRGDVIETIQNRSTNFQKLLWMEQGAAFQLAVEAEMPAAVREAMAPEKRRFSNVRYELEIGLDPSTNQIGLNHETLWLLEPELPTIRARRELFPAQRRRCPRSCVHPERKDRRLSQRRLTATTTTTLKVGKAISLRLGWAVDDLHWRTFRLIRRVFQSAFGSGNFLRREFSHWYLTVNRFEIQALPD